MITPAYSSTATERVLPRLALDFTTAILDARVAITRALNTATAVNSSGYIAGVNANLPRFDYDPSTLVCKGLLIEESRANVLTYSVGTGASWSQISATPAANASVSPDGTVNATKLVENSGGTSHVTYQVVAVSATSYTLSCYAKSSTRSQIYLDFTGGTNGAVFDLLLGTVVSSTGAGLTAAIRDAGNGWYRCSITQTQAATTIYPAVGLAVAGSISYSGDGTSGAFIWGAQLEAGAFATSYIPTTTTSLTRNADTVTMTGTNFSSWWNASEGTFVLTADAAYGNGSPRLMEASAGASSRVVDLYMINAPGVQMFNGTTAWNANGNFTLNQPFKVAAAYKSGDYGVSLAGTTPVTKTDALLNTANTLQIGRYSGGFSYMNGHIAKINYYPQRLTNAELQAFSK